MGFRFFRRMRIAPGITLNLSKSGGSLSFGPRGAKVTVGPRGTHATAGLPGTGLFYTQKVDLRPRSAARGRRRGSSRSAVAHPSTKTVSPPAERLELSFFDRLRTPKREEHFVDAARALVQGDLETAGRHAEQAADGEGLADGCFIAGSVALARGDRARAETYFRQAFVRRKSLGKLFDKYGVIADLNLPITHHVAVKVQADERGVLLVLAELAQSRGAADDAAKLMRRLHRAFPDDLVARLSMAELLFEEADRSPDRGRWTQIVELGSAVANDSDVHAGLLYYKAMALRRLELHTAARDVLTALLRRRKDRDTELLRAIRYERALVYAALGRAAQSRSDLERIFAEDPNHEDVAERLGVRG